MTSIQEIYRKKTKASSRLFAKAKKVHINGVHHNIRFFEPYPFITKSAEGRFLKDVDSNKYVDYWMGHWSLILGHAQEQIQKKTSSQLKKSWMHGTSNENTILFSEKISKAVRVAEKIRYTTDLLKTVNWPFDISESQGLTDEEHIVSLPLNNLQESLKILKSVKKDLAGVLVEPVLGGGGAIPATKEYLQGLQEMVKTNNSLFMLDEIVTGFRFRYGCIYPTMKLDPDIVTLGKIVGLSLIHI